MSTHHALLGLLALGERYGYEMQRDLATLDEAWRLEHGQVYRLLARLERDGCVKSRNEPGQNGPSRKLFRLTEAGRRELRKWLSDPESHIRQARDELPIKLTIGRSIGNPGIYQLIDTRYHQLEEKLNKIMGKRALLDRVRDSDQLLILETHRRHLEGSLQALQTYRGQLVSEFTDGGLPGASERIEAAGSDDPVLRVLANHLARRNPPVLFSSRPLGSLGGLLALREGRAHLAGTHLLDVETGEYNVPFVKKLLFEESVLLVNLTYREQGLMVAAGNPKKIKGLKDLIRSDVRLLNRQRGAGTRLLLHASLRRAGLEPKDVAGFETEAPTHEAVALAIARDTVDAGMGIRAVAEEKGLEFIPVGLERFDLAILQTHYDSPRFEPLREVLKDPSFREEVGSRIGYNLSHMGEVVAQIR